jgi:hypothetical protein
MEPAAAGSSAVCAGHVCRCDVALVQMHAGGGPLLTAAAIVHSSTAWAWCTAQLWCDILCALAEHCVDTTGAGSTNV